MRPQPLLLTLLLAPSLALADGTIGGRLQDAEGRPVSEAELARRLEAAQLVFVGEEHGRAAHHLFQRDVLKALADEGPVVLGVEYFPRTLQPILDRFHRGELSVEAMREAVSWEKVWGHNWEAYKPIFELCAARKIRVVGLNAEKSLVGRVRERGLKNLPVEELLLLPRMDITNEAHERRVKAAINAAHPLPDEALARYYEIFLLWEETMADTAARVFLEDRRPGLKMLVLAGRGHIETGTGIPDRLTRRMPAKRLVIVCGEPSGAPDELTFSVPQARLY